MQITAELVTFVIGVIVFVSGVWWRIEGKIKEAKSEAVIAASSAAAKADLVGDHLAEFRILVAQKYIDKDDMREFRDEIMRAMRELKGGVDHLNERIDRVIVTPPGGRRASPRT